APHERFEKKNGPAELAPAPHIALMPAPEIAKPARANGIAGWCRRRHNARAERQERILDGAVLAWMACRLCQTPCTFEIALSKEEHFADGYADAERGGCALPTRAIAIEHRAFEFANKIGGPFGHSNSGEKANIVGQLAHHRRDGARFQLDIGIALQNKIMAH